MTKLAALLSMLVVCVISGCYDTYCQSGSKYGTQCYTGADLEANQRAQGRNEPASEQNKWWKTGTPSTKKSATPAPPPKPPAVLVRADAGAQ